MAPGLTSRLRVLAKLCEASVGLLFFLVFKMIRFSKVERRTLVDHRRERDSVLMPSHLFVHVATPRCRYATFAADSSITLDWSVLVIRSR